MAVKDIEIYGDVAKIILKPTEKFPNGYFYTDNNPVAINLVNNYTWYLHKDRNNIAVVAAIYTPNTGKRLLRFHQEYAKRILDYYPDYIDHISGLEIDNRDINLNVVNNQQNIRNRPTVGYHIYYGNLFVPSCRLNGRIIQRGSYKTEPEALLATYQLRQEVYADYNYNFYLDRRGDEDILDAELTKKITTQQAIYLHVKRYVSNNPWFVYRYNLFDYCRQYSIVIPHHNLDNQGFMIHPETHKRLCPY